MPKLKSDFCEFLFRENEKYKDELFEAIKKAERKNLKIFGFKPKKYIVELVYSNEEYDKKTNLKGIETYRGGFLKDNKFIIISPTIKELEFDFDSYFIHEINHIFYLSIVGHNNLQWLTEGMACFYQGTFNPDIEGWKRYFRALDKPEKFLYYRFIKEKFYKNSDKFYTLSYIVFLYLEKKFGIRKIINFLKEYSKNPNKKNFDSLLKQRFGLNSNKLVWTSLK